MSRRGFVAIALLALILALPASRRAGANTWAGGRPGETAAREPTRIGASADGRTRVLFSSPDGHGVRLLMDPTTR